MTASLPAVLVFDGIFLHRPELRDEWDISIFLDVPFAESYRRMSLRDGCSADPLAVANRRYYAGQQLYLAEVNPAAAADIVIDNADVDHPRLVRWNGVRPT